MWQLVILGVITASIVLGIFIWASYRYVGSTDFLIIQNGNSDLYSLSKSAEYVSNVLGDAIYSDLFLNEAVKLNKFDNSWVFSSDKSRLNDWKKVVKVKQNFQSSILTVQVKGDNASHVLSVSGAIGEVLTKENNLFRSGDPSSLTVKVLSGPRIDTNPSLLEMVAVAAAGFVAGVLLIGSWIIVSHRVHREEEVVITETQTT